MQFTVNHWNNTNHLLKVNTMKSKISKEKQLAIIELVRAGLVNKTYNNGLCYAFQDIISQELHISIYYSSIKEYFPLFTQENAIKYANGDTNRFVWWWTTGVNFDYKNRILFLDWMSSKIKTSSAIADLWKKIIKYINNPVVIIKYPIN